MDSTNTHNHPTEAIQENVAIETTSFAGDERGQISALVVLCVVPFVLLLAFIFNSGFQTSRKIQLQGAADAASVASAVTVARGMNFIVLNNNAMAEVLSYMVAIRCIRNTTKIMAAYLTIRAGITCAAAAICSIFCPGVVRDCIDLTRAAIRWHQLSSTWSRIDDFVNNESSGFGWTVLDLLDRLNQASKFAFALWAGLQAREYARKNGADLDPAYGFMIGGKSNGLPIGGYSIPLPVPTFPVARGPEQAIAYRAEDCQYAFIGKLNAAVSLYLVVIDPKRTIESQALYQALRWANLNHLKGNWGFIGSIFNQILARLPGILVRFLGRITGILGSFLGIDILGWRSNPPKPMLLTDHPENATTNELALSVAAKRRVRPYLQYLGIALGRVPLGSRIGDRLFLNKPNAFVQVQFTYAQADVYNPTEWDMWTQDWRAQLTRAQLFDQKVTDLLRVLSLPTAAPNWSFVNTH